MPPITGREESWKYARLFTILKRGVFTTDWDIALALDIDRTDVEDFIRAAIQMTGKTMRVEKKPLPDGLFAYRRAVRQATQRPKGEQPLFTLD